ncbi:helix-turn-helix transcriptional regulator [Paenibacillus eucommiae]|uniref:AraC-like DNA-binding protein n=1 Tax=Paenibacillus eucommiae TaxID=1355755 RepID=A0ABS4IPA5_9BACL|nr:helix-turn-helix domain-containing protein [Paenibacillus eucommiae]MBP1988454.1 AraC-like DNA-binding protein [Paenibacillus eucommiae]
MHIRMFDFVCDYNRPANQLQASQFSPLLIHPDHHEMLYIIEGTVLLHSINHQYEIVGPSLILLPLNTFHQLIHISKHYCYAYWELEDDANGSFPQPHQCTIWNDLQSTLDRTLPHVDMLYQRMNELITLMNTDWMQQHPELIHEITLSDITAILALTRHAVKPYEPSEKITPLTNSRITPTKETIEMLVRWMEESYWDNITLQTLSERVHFNSSYLIRMFREYQGETPFQYLNRLRMNAAISYLANSSLSIQEIAFTIGYQSIHYFSRLFKQTYGTSPAQWRIEHKIPVQQNGN